MLTNKKGLSNLKPNLSKYVRQDMHIAVSATANVRSQFLGSFQCSPLGASTRKWTGGHVFHTCWTNYLGGPWGSSRDDQHSLRYRPYILPTYRPYILPTYRPYILPTYRPYILPTYRPYILPTYFKFAVETLVNTWRQGSWPESVVLWWQVQEICKWTLLLFYYLNIYLFTYLLTIIIIILLNCNWVLPDGSGTTIRHNTQKYTCHTK
jgi:hypothetical protein